MGGLVIAAIGIPIGVLIFRLTIMSLVVVLLVAMVVPHFTLKLKLGPDGVEIGGDLGGRTARWDRLELRASRWGESLRSPAGTPRRERVNVWLPMFEPRWRFGRIGRCFREWAPDLLEDSLDENP